MHLRQHGCFRENGVSNNASIHCYESEDRARLLFRDSNGSKTFYFYSGYEFIQSNLPLIESKAIRFPFIGAPFYRKRGSSDYSVRVAVWRFGMPFFAILALLTTALTVVNSGTDVERLWDADIVAERYRAPKIIIAVVTMITTAIVLPVRYYPLSALLGIFCRFDETANITRCSEEKRKKNTARGKMGRKKCVEEREVWREKTGSLRWMVRGNREQRSPSFPCVCYFARYSNKRMFRPVARSSRRTDEVVK